MVCACAVVVAVSTLHVVNRTGQPQINLPRTSLLAVPAYIYVQVATTPAQRDVGLMFRKQLPPDDEMLFVFNKPRVQCFWMRNTPLPLAAAFIASDGTIMNLADMAPETTSSHCSVRPVRFVLEMNQGWFAQRAIKAGFKLRGEPFKSR